MTQQDRLRRQQLVGRLKASIATAAVVATFGGWAAFGMQQPATATDSTVAVSPTATAVSQTSQSGITPSAPSEQSDNSTTEVVPSSSSRSFLQRRAGNIDALITMRHAMQEYRFRAMGCQMLAVVDSDDPSFATQLAAVPNWFEGWEQQLSRFRPDSDLSRLNAMNGAPVVVPPALWQVLAVALDIAEQSEGLVQPTILAALEASGYDRSFDELAPLIAGTPLPAQAGDWRAIRLDYQRQAVTLPAGVRLDLGGVAKGWAADQATRYLTMAGPALVDAGGDISVSGSMADGAPWPIAITNPFTPEESLAILLLAHGAVATSGRDYRRWMRGGTEQHHIIDPRSGQPAQTDVLSATVIAPDGPSAEMAAKVVLILGSSAGLAWLDARSDLAGLVVLEDGRILRSQRMDAYLDTISLPSRIPTRLAAAQL